MNKILFRKKIKIVLKDNKILLFILSFWFGGGFFVYFCIYQFGFWAALKASLFLTNIEGVFVNAYEMWSQGIVFGVIFTFLVQNMIEKYIPERSCRMIAKEMENHVVVIGYSHLGERLVKHYQEEKIPYCLIEKDKEKVDELLRQGAPVVVDNAKDFDALRDAGVAKAKSVIIASNNLETALIVTKRVRQMNKEVKIITRCFMEEFDEILETLGANEVISSSKNAFKDILTIS